MSFLDNSGDIILDAVLTDLGRKKMADGNFKIDMFALGDDEINYSSYNKSHPSGSAYYDLEILQTPILQAFTQINAGINYGLLTLNNTDILYMPTLVPNELRSPMQGRKNGIYYVAVNTETATSLKDNGGLTDKQIQNTMTNQDPSIYIESGIDTTELSNTQANQGTYVIGTGLSNETYTLSVDRRIIGSIMVPAADGQFSLSSDGQTFTISKNLQDQVGNVNDGNMKNYSSYSVSGIRSQVYQTSTGESATSFTAVSGPTDTITYFKVLVLDELRTTSTTAPTLYSTLGKTGATAASLSLAGSDTYDYIDTMVYITGNSSGAQMGISLRIIRKAS